MPAAFFIEPAFTIPCPKCGGTIMSRPGDPLLRLPRDPVPGDRVYFPTPHFDNTNVAPDMCDFAWVYDPYKEEWVED